MVSIGHWNGECWSPEEGTSSTTQPYFEDDEWEQFFDSGCSTPGNDAKANPEQYRGRSPACPTPSPLPPRRPNVHIKAAAAAVAANSREPCAAPTSTSNIQIYAALNSRKTFAPSTSTFQTNAAGEACLPRTSQGYGISIASPLVSNRKPHQIRFEDPFITGREGDGRTTRTAFHGVHTHFSYSRQSTMWSPSLPTRDGASGSTTPEGEATPGGSPIQGPQTKPVCHEAEHTRKRMAPRPLFPENVRKISFNEDVQNLVQLKGPAMPDKTYNFRTEGATTPCPGNVQWRAVGSVSGINDGKPSLNSHSINRRATESYRRRVFGEPEHIPFPLSNPHLQVLGSVDFIKAFQLLEKLNGRNLEEAYSIEDIQKLKSVSKANVQVHLGRMDSLRRHHRETKSSSWQEVSSFENHRFECCVNSTGGKIFKISKQKERLTALQRCFGPDRVLRVFFADKRRCREIMKEGIFVGLRYYQYWTHKDTGKDFEKKKTVDEKFWSSTHCYFVCTSSEAATDKKNKDFRQFRTIREARCHMMHIHTTPNIPKYTSRLQLALSQTQPVDLDFSTISVEVIEDIYCKDYDTGLETMATDGTGYISVDLAKEIATSLKNGMTKPENLFGTQEYPSLIQIRLFHQGSASKGTLLANNKLKPRTIVLRKSMRKVESDPELSDLQSFNSLEICGSSMPAREAKLSRDLIVLLTLGGVPRSFFMELVDEAIQRVRNVLTNPGAAWKAIRDFDCELAKIAQRMLLAGISPKEPFLQKTLMDLRKDMLQDFRTGRVSLPDSCYLYGTADPTGTLEPDQVAITLDYGLVSWAEVGVFKFPGKHPGDFHKFQAVANKEIQEIVGNSKYVIFFSTKGPRSIPDEIAGSDLDGDKYFITWNPKLLANYKEDQTRWLKKPDESREPVMCRPVDLSWQQLEDSLIDKFINSRFHPSQRVGTVSNWWLGHMDQHLLLKDSDPGQSEWHKSIAMDLVGIFYSLLDSEKTGITVRYSLTLKPDKSPHFNNGKGEKDEKTKNPFGYGVYINPNGDNTYKSSTILGEIYDTAIRAEENWRPQSDEIELEPAFEIKENKVEFNSAFREWSKLFAKYKKEMQECMENTELDPQSREAGCSAIYLRYKRRLYHADSLDKSKRATDVIFVHASAIYAVVYHENISQLKRRSSANGWAPSFLFAWKVAGATLCKMFEKYYRQHGEEQLIMSLQIFESFFGKSYAQDIAKDSSSHGEED